MQQASLKDPDGTRHDAELEIERQTAPPLRPALFASYGDLSRLRYDYPLVLVDGAGDGPIVMPLKEIIDGVLREVAEPGAAGEELRQQILRLEAGIRRRIDRGERGSLKDMWRSVAAELVAASGEPAFGPLDTNYDRAREALRVDGAVTGCDAGTPKEVLVHAWRIDHEAKAKAFRKTVDGLILRLSDILKADYMKSEAARSPEALRAAVGDSFGGAFDFHSLSRILNKGHKDDTVTSERQQRIERVLWTLRSQRFYGPGRSSERRPGQPEPHRFVFDSCGEALDAFRDRLPEILELIKAVSIAELEIENKYRAHLHDPFFDDFGKSDLTEDQLSMLPSSLVCLRDGHTDTAETLQAFEALASGLPVKVLIQTDDILGNTTPEPSRTAFGVGSARLAAMAMGLNRAFVLQASGAHLPRVQDRLACGLAYDGPALFCVFSGSVETVPFVAPYLMAAAATESRAFPTFTYDPSAGPDWASRFDLAENPQPEATWPGHRIEFEDAALQRCEEKLEFGYADFAVADSRYHQFVELHDSAAWNDNMCPAGEYLRLSPDSRDGKQPYVLVIDPENRLYRAVVDEKIIDAAEHCCDAWRRLQELAGINNSHAERLLARERAAWEAEQASRERADEEAGEPGVSPAAGQPVPVELPPAPAEELASEAPAEQEPGGDGPWIETARCTTCNECTQINNKLFAYNEDMQAYIADPDAGSFRQIVEAAESCQVSIIHPGKPRDPNEPDLEELIDRAAPFN
ncbi:MAG: ferredoxin [Paracoccaceae bacterium]